MTLPVAMRTDASELSLISADAQEVHTDIAPSASDDDTAVGYYATLGEDHLRL